MLREQAFTRCKPNVLEWGHIMILGFPYLQVSIVPFKVVRFGVYTLGPALLPLLDASVDLPFRDAFHHHLKFKLNLCDILESLCL